MTKLFRFMIMAAVAVGTASVAGAGELKLSIANGRVTLTATDVQIRQILAEWTRVGGTVIVGGDKLVGQNVTLQLVDQPEREALEILLKSAAGYVVSQRPQLQATGSVFDRIMILPTSRPPAFNAAAAPPPAPFARPQPQAQPDEDEPVEPVPLTPPQGPPGSGIQQQPGMPPQQQQLTSPRPGMLPAAPGVPPNPYAAPPGTPLPPGGRGGGPGTPGAPGPGGRGGQQ